MSLSTQTKIGQTRTTSQHPKGRALAKFFAQALSQTTKIAPDAEPFSSPFFKAPGVKIHLDSCGGTNDPQFALVHIDTLLSQWKPKAKTPMSRLLFAKLCDSVTTYKDIPDAHIFFAVLSQKPEMIPRIWWHKQNDLSMS